MALMNGDGASVRSTKGDVTEEVLGDRWLGPCRDGACWKGGLDYKHGEGCF